MRFSILIIVVSILSACGGGSTATNKSVSNANRSSNSAPMYTYEIVNTYPHDPKAFTQGLDFYNGSLYEGTGGKHGDPFYSSLRKVDIATGKVLQKYDLPREFFGEGITILNDKIYQVTWQERTGFVYDLNDFKLLREFRYAGDGWGLTTDGTNLILSDGTHVMRVMDPETFQTIRTIVALDEKGQPVMRLNELEYIKGEIWANVWETGLIVRVDPATGKVTGRIDLTQLAQKERDASEDADVLNGIAYDETADRIFVTGKMWKRLFEIKVNPK